MDLSAKSGESKTKRSMTERSFKFASWRFRYSLSVSNADGNEIKPVATPAAMQIAAEEGRLRKASGDVVDSSESLSFNNTGSFLHSSVNYPVGKPLEVRKPISDVTS